MTPIPADLTAALDSLSPLQLAWLSGYCWARADGGDALDGEAPLRGGRWIGPLERLLLLLLASMGVHAAIAAVIAAKGVIRFPEISRDERGDKAEEFLIGSLASWALAVLAAVLLTR